MYVHKKSLYAAALSDWQTMTFTALCFFGTQACTDGILNSGADWGSSPTTEDSETASETEVDTASSAPACGRFSAVIDGSDVCWYVGPPFQSCTDTCASLGGVHPDAASYVGTPEQGGSAEKCSAVLQALRYFGFVRAIPAPTEKGLGCYIFMDGYHYWITDLSFDPDQKEYGTNMVCGCNN